MSFVNKPGLLAIVQSVFASPQIGFVGPTSVFWRKDTTPMISPVDAARCTLEIIHRKAYGTDDYHYSFDDTGDPDTSTLTTTTFGNRDFTVQLRLDMYAADAEAQDVLDTAAALLWAPWLQPQFVAVNHGLQGTSDAYDVTGSSADNRVVSSAVVEMTLNSVSSVAQTSPPGQGWIETWNGDGIVPFDGMCAGAVLLPGLRCVAVCG